MTSKRRKVVLFLLGVIVVVASAAYLTRDREPTYKGKPLNYWIVQLCPMNLNPSSPDRPDAQEAVRHIGTNAIPYLLKWIRYEPPSARPIPETMGSLINQLPRTVRDRVPDSVTVWIEGNWIFGEAFGSPEAFAILGTTAQAAVPDLEKLLLDRSKTNTSILAMFCLSAMGTNAVPAIIARLQSSDPWQRIAAMEAIDSFAATRTNAQPAVPSLVQCLTNSEASVRRRAAYTLSRMAETDQSQAALMVPALTNYFHTAINPSDRLAATRALGKCGPQAIVALPVLLEGIADPVSDVRTAATNALRIIAPEALTNAPPQF